MTPVEQTLIGLTYVVAVVCVLAILALLIVLAHRAVYRRLGSHVTAAVEPSNCRVIPDHRRSL